MNEREHNVFIKTRVRNLKRKYAKMVQHPEMSENALELKREIELLESEL